MKDDPAITDEIKALIADMLERRLDDARKARLAQLLLESEAVRSYYVQLTQQHASLHWYLKAASQEESKAENKADRIGALAALAKIAEYESNKPLTLSTSEAEAQRLHGQGARRTRPWLFAAASLLLAAMLGLVFVIFTPSSTPPGPVAAITRTHNAVWKNAGGQLETRAAGTRLAPGSMELAEGEAELTFDDGAIVVVDAYEEAARFRIDSRSQVSLTQGRLTTHMTQNATGVFTVRAPALRVTNQKASFGMRVRSTGAGELHVFRGNVSAFRPQARDKARATTIVATNQALRFKADGQTVETVAAESKSFFGQLRDDKDLALAPTPDPVKPVAPQPPAGPLLTAVTASSGSTCTIHPNLSSGDLVYTDRFHVWRDVPEALQGAEYARVANSDKGEPGNRIMVTVSRPAVIYVLWNPNADRNDQRWLTDNLRNTGQIIKVDRIDREGQAPKLVLHYQIWRREIPAGTFELGPFEETQRGLPGIAVVDAAKAGL